MQIDMTRSRVAVAGLALSALGLVAIVSQEGYTDKAVIPVAGDVPTVGFGTTRKEDGTPVRMGDKTTPTKALNQALRDVQKFEGAIKHCVQVPLYQYEYDAFTSLAYNIGPTAFCGSTLVKKLNEKNYPGACQEIKRWDRFNGQPLRGLTVRREAEYQQCIGANA